jgi:hypothetical protein
MNAPGDPPGAVAVSTLEQPEPATGLAQQPRSLVIADGGRQGWLDQATCGDLDPER